MISEFKNAFQRPNHAHVQLIIVNVAIFLLLGVLMVICKIANAPAFFDAVYQQFELPSELGKFIRAPWTIFTYGFAHFFAYEAGYADIFHIFFNMLVFYWFGKLFVEYLGSDKLVAVYILGVLSGGFFYLLLYNTLPIFSTHTATLIGSSAAVYAVMVAAATLLPNYTFFLLFLGPVRIKYIVGFYIVLSFLGSVGSNAGGNIAHLGGALMGFVYIRQLQVGVNWGGWITAVLTWIRGLFEPSQKVKVTYRSERSGARPQKATRASQEEIDAILDKISERGYESLTKEEKEKLFNASKK